MTTYNITCSGPGPHSPASGILGTSDRPPTADVRCGSSSCIKPPDPTIVNAATLQGKAAAALAANQGYLGIATPTTAQAVAQVAALTRQMNAVIRLVLNQFDDVN